MCFPEIGLPDILIIQGEITPPHPFHTLIDPSSPLLPLPLSATPFGLK
jgi:hypothetical protein